MTWPIVTTTCVLPIPHGRLSVAHRIPCAQKQLRALAGTHYNIESGLIPRWTELGADWDAFVREVRFSVAAPHLPLETLRAGLRNVSCI